MAEIDEKTLRETKDHLVGGFADLQRRGGKLPDVKQAEAIIDPVLHKVSVDRASEPAPQPAPQPQQKTLTAGQWYGEPGHSPRIGDRSTSAIAPPGKGETLEVFTKEVGEYRFGAGPHMVPVGDAATGARRAGPYETMVRDLVKLLWELPEWRAKFSAIVLSNQSDAERDKSYRRVLADAVRLFGDPKPTAVKDDPKIIVSG